MAADVGRRLRSLPRRLGFRLVVAMLAVSLPLMVVPAVLLTSSASSSLSSSAELSLDPPNKRVMITRGTPTHK
jgi:ABC-type uncharacterized transport system permease subunit